MSFSPKAIPKKLMKMVFWKRAFLVQIAFSNSYQPNTSLAVWLVKIAKPFQKTLFGQKAHATKHPLYNERLNLKELFTQSLTFAKEVRRRKYDLEKRALTRSNEVVIVKKEEKVRSFAYFVNKNKDINCPQSKSNLS